MSDAHVPPSGGGARPPDAWGRPRPGSDEERLTYTVPECAARLGVSERHVWRQIASGRIRALRLGGRTLVTRCALEGLLAEAAPESLPAEGAPSAPTMPSRPLRRIRV